MKSDVLGQEGGRILDIDEQGLWGLENWTTFMDVICISSVRKLFKMRGATIIHCFFAALNSKKSFSSISCRAI